MGSQLLSILQSRHDEQLHLSEQKDGHAENPGKRILGQSRQVVASPYADTSPDRAERFVQDDGVRLRFEVIEQAQEITLRSHRFAALGGSWAARFTVRFRRSRHRLSSTRRLRCSEGNKTVGGVQARPVPDHLLQPTQQLHAFAAVDSALVANQEMPTCVSE